MKANISAAVAFTAQSIRSLQPHDGQSFVDAFVKNAGIFTWLASAYTSWTVILIVAKVVCHLSEGAKTVAAWASRQFSRNGDADMRRADSMEAGTGRVEKYEGGCVKIEGA
jgi:hypothetical protein